jgi:hypothetical protein
MCFGTLVLWFGLLSVCLVQLITRWSCFFVHR